MASAAGFRSLLAVPLLARGHSVGVLSVYSVETDAFSAEDVELVQTFASQAALAIDTARLYGREHRVASVLQASILPEELPIIAGIDVASVYRPSGLESEIGGDYYDLFLAPDGSVVMVIADVVGKGVAAATKTSMIRYAVRGMVAAGLGPGAVLGELNRMVAESGDPSEIVTVWIGFLDRETDVLTWADAGHPPALVLPPGGGTPARLGPTGPLLGGIAGAVYEVGAQPLPPGAIALLYTDGVTEARSGLRFFGEGRVRRALRGGGSPAEVAQRLTAAVDRFAGSSLRDDAAILVVRRSDE
jgi:serine phosphatase RsbU (regulator of sigma subunit)